MKKTTTLAAASLLLMGLVMPFYSMRDDNKEAVAGALFSLGAAALSHHDDHHKNAKHHTQTQQIYDFDRGYKDGLHKAAYDHRDDSPEYNDGYASIHKERHNQRAHHHNHSEGPNAPILALQGCVGEASSRWDRSPRDIHLQIRRIDKIMLA